MKNQEIKAIKVQTNEKLSRLMSVAPIHAGTCWKWGASGNWDLQESDFTGYGNHMIRAVVSASPSCPDCSGDVVSLHDVIFPAGVSCRCVATTSITIGVGVEMPDGAAVTFKAPKVTIGNGFHAEGGSTVYIRQE